MAVNSIFKEFDKHLPKFNISSSDVTILDTPTSFHDALLSKILQAKRRIVLASLYITPGTELLRNIRLALTVHKELEVLVLLDSLRGTRPDPGCGPDAETSASGLATLVHDFGIQRVQVRLYHTPNLRGLWKCAVPRRLNEGFGLQHIKLCVFDDELILTGANLAPEYFTSRQDRYYIFNSAELTGFCCSLVHILGDFSYLLLPSKPQTSSPGQLRNFTLCWPKSNLLPQPLEKSKLSDIHRATANHLVPLIWRESQENGRGATEGSDTAVYPLVQLTQLIGNCDGAADQKLPNKSTQEWAVFRLLTLLPESRSWTLSTPYLRLPKSLTQYLIRSSSMGCTPPHDNNEVWTCGKIIVASREAMSFYGARGLAGFIPAAFEREAQQLFKVMQPRMAPRRSLGSFRSPKLLHWRRGIAHQTGGWTFHAKGWWMRGLNWVSPKGIQSSSRDITATVIGSSNYGERSFKLDLELDVLIVTSNLDLKRRIHDEERKILSRGTEVNKHDNRAVGTIHGVIVVVLMWIIWLTGLSI